MNFLKQKYVLLTLRSLFGLMLVVFGINHVIPFMPMGPFEGAMAVFMDGIVASQYIIPVTGVIMFLAGIAFLTNKFVPLGVLVMAPLSVNFVLVHAFLMPATIAGAAVVALLNLYMAYIHWDAFKHLFKARG